MSDEESATRTPRTDGGTVGTDDNPVDVFTQLDLAPFLNMADGGKIYADNFHIETASGKYTFKAEDDNLIIEYSENTDDE